MKNLYYIFVAIILNGCIDLPNDINMPEWDVDLNLPITDRFYNIDSLLKDSDYSRVENIGNYIVYSFYTDTLKYKSGIAEFLENKLDFEYLNFKFPLAEGNLQVNIPLPDSISIETATFLSGNCSIELQNLSATPFSYDITFSDFSNAQGSLNLNNSISEYELQTYKFGLDDLEANLSDNNNISLSVNAKGNFNQSDSAIFSIRFTKTNIEYLKGKLPPTFIENISESINIDFDKQVEDFRNHIKLDGAQLFINAKYISDYVNIPEVKFIKLALIGSFQNDSVYFEENGNNSLSDIVFTGSTFNKIYDSDNSNVNDFISFLPSSISFSGNSIINPNNKYFEASIFDSIEVNSFIKAPLALNIDSISIIDTVEHKIGSEKENLEDANEATIFCRLTNGLPVDIVAIITIVDNMFQNIVTKNFNILPAETLNEIEFVPNISNISIPLDSLDLNRISKSFFVIYKLQLKSSTDIITKFKATDGIDIKSYLEIDYRIKED